MTINKEPSGSNKAEAIKVVTTDGRQFFNSEQKLSELRRVKATTTELEDITDAINTGTAKELGYMVLNTTTGLTVFASGNTDGAVWHYYDSSTAHTPV